MLQKALCIILIPLWAQSVLALPLELTSLEYRKIWSRNKAFILDERDSTTLSPEVKLSLKGGEKLFNWLKAINEKRPATEQIQLSDPSTSTGIPIERPKKYGPSTIKKGLEQLLIEMPLEMKKVVYQDGELTNDLPNNINKETFIKYARRASGLYSTSIRWSTLIVKHRAWFSHRKSKDVRGFYYLNKIEDLDNKLKSFPNLSQEIQDNFKKYLINICINQRDTIQKAYCRRSLKSSIDNGTLVAYKNLYWENAQKLWHSFFDITNPRTDIKWNAQNPDRLIIPFLQIENQSLSRWLQENVEDEFKNNEWQLDINFSPNHYYGMPELQLKKNVNPHVREWNIIVMNNTLDLNEYSERWIIRHEFGHVLRLPDCYLEFYDEEEDLAVSYQLDITDLMCSRKGKFNQRIFNELKRVYFKN